MTKSFYLAHGLERRIEVRKMQLRIQGKFNIKFINPFYNNKYERQEIEALDGMNKRERKRYTESWTIQTCHKIVHIDLELIRKADGLFAFLPSPSIGTCQEIIMAALVYQMPVYIITKDYRSHPWLRSLATRSGGGIFKNITEFKMFLKKEVGEKE